MNYRYYIANSFGEIYAYKRLKSAINCAYRLARSGIFGMFRDAQSDIVFTHVDPLSAWYEGIQP